MIELAGKKILFVAPHPDDDVIGCGALLLSLVPDSITVAYAVSGFNGVTDRFAQKVDSGFSDRSDREKQAIKSQIRRREALASCDYLGIESIFWNLPFYEKQKQEKKLARNDLAIIESSIRYINPDVVFLIDEMSDPHKTHATVHVLTLQALKNISFRGKVFGYRVWDPVYAKSQCDMTLFFDEHAMAEKTKLISFHASQILDPAFPHEHHSFIELVKVSNRHVAKQCASDKPYGECYRKLEVF
ncbi:PIG-L family deacetylase [Candidatus Dependentiae bacterium]|nr:PIG-L family deacetylase [Candidatus Dependentiae bacterium]